MSSRLGTAVAAAALLLAGLVTTTAAGTSLARPCYQQLDNDNGVGIVSQNFERDLDIYDSRAADDFRLTTRCKVSQVVVNGSYSLGVGPARSVHVTFYRDNDGRVGRIIDTQDDVRFRDDSGVGNLTVTLQSSVDLRPGRYWVSVKANLDFGTGGQWGWNTNNEQVGVKAKWANPNDGFGTGCVRYRSTAKCLPSGQGPDFSFALLG